MSAFDLIFSISREAVALLIKKNTEVIFNDLARLTNTWLRENELSKKVLVLHNSNSTIRYQKNTFRFRFVLFTSSLNREKLKAIIRLACLFNIHD